MKKRNIECLMLGICLAASLPAQTRSWSGSYSHPDGTTHWYEAVAVTDGITWTDANRAAALAGGRLASITTAEENTAVVNLIQDSRLWTGQSGPWLGGLLWGVTPVTWGWTELESFQFTAWASGQPASKSATERVHYGGSSATTAGTWASSPETTKLRGYVIEYAGPRVPRTVGLQRREKKSFDGYTLLMPAGSKVTYLVDPRGRVVHTWTSTYKPGMAAYLEPNGNLLRCGTDGNKTFTAGGAGGVVEVFDWDGKLVWQFKHSDKNVCLHHDVERLPNGNLLMISWEMKTKAEALAAGRDPKMITQDAVWPEKIIEVQPTGKDTGKIVWEWHVWDHLVQDFDSKKANYGDPAKNPQLVDINYTLVDGRADWLHANAIAYNAELDQIVISLRMFSEIWVIDHSTTTKEAASHSGGKSGKGGDLLYRWGNLAAYRAGKKEDQILYYQHNSHWIPDGLSGAGNILILNNGFGRGYSSVEEITPPKPDAKGNYPMSNGVWGPSKATWQYTAPNKGDFYALFVSGCDRLPNGNTLICNGVVGKSFEVTPTGKTVWEYVSPVAATIAKQGDPGTQRVVFRSPRYAPDYPGLKGRTLTAGDPIEEHDSVLLVEGSTVDHVTKPGTSVRFSLRAKHHAGREYVVASSATDGLLQIDQRFVPLGWDMFLAASLWSTPSTVFQNYAGSLDAKGLGNATLSIPNLSSLVGLKVYTCFVVKDPFVRAGLGLISNRVVVEIGS